MAKIDELVKLREAGKPWATIVTLTSFATIGAARAYYCRHRSKDLKIVECPYCGEEFKTEFKKFCSVKCCTTYHGLRYLKPLTVVHCDYCHKPFVPEGKHHRFCSTPCSWRVKKRIVLKYCLGCHGIFRSSRDAHKYCHADCKYSSSLKPNLVKCEVCKSVYNKIGVKRFCTEKCRVVGREEEKRIRQTIRCHWCEDYFRRIGNQLYCGKECRNAMLALGVRIKRRALKEHELLGNFGSLKIIKR